jgi:hypothetical protein
VLCFVWQVTEEKAAVQKAREEHTAKMTSERAEIEKQLRAADDEADRLQELKETLEQGASGAPVIAVPVASGDTAAMQAALDAAKADLEDFKVCNTTR